MIDHFEPAKFSEEDLKELIKAYRANIARAAGCPERMLMSLQSAQDLGLIPKPYSRRHTNRKLKWKRNMKKNFLLMPTNSTEAFYYFR